MLNQRLHTLKNKMAETSKLKKPRRKKGAKFHPKDAPFPVPIESITTKECADSRWFYYTGYFRDNCVVIENHGDLTFLYKMGFFGEGNLSRSKPEYEIISNISQKAFSKSEKLRRLPPKERQIRQSKFRDIRKERLKNHKEWYKLSNEITSAKPVKTSRELVHNEKKDELAGTSYGDTLIAGDDDFEDLPEKKRRKKEFEDSDSDLNEDETNHIGPDMEEEKEDKKEVLGDSNMDTENKKGNRDVEEVMQDVLRHSKEELTNNDVTLSSQDLQLKQKTMANKKDDPYKVFEHLQLSLEEAFFLSYGLGCLTVYDNDKRPLTISEMWTRFRRAKKDFIPCYVVYHYLRSKGWVPKSGIKYGTDFVLYKQGMPFYHSSYSIIVQVADEDSLAPSCFHTALLGHRGPLSWLSIGGPNRVSEHAAKEVMICYVIVPSGITDQELSLSSCIPRFKVQEVIMRRWIPERSRDSTGKQK